MTEIPKPILLVLSAEQSLALEPYLGVLKEMHDQGKPGMLLAQLDGVHMKCGVVSHEMAQAIRRAMGNDEWKTIKSLAEAEKEKRQGRDDDRHR